MANLLQVLCHADGEFSVVLSEGDASVTYEFRVDQKDGLDVVTWDDSFGEILLRGNVPVEPVLEAVLAVSKARRAVARLSGIHGAPERAKTDQPSDRS